MSEIEFVRIYHMVIDGPAKTYSYGYFQNQQSIQQILQDCHDRKYVLNQVISTS